VVVGSRFAALSARSGTSVQGLASFLDVSSGRVVSYEDEMVLAAACDVIELCRFFRLRLEDVFPNYDPNRNPKSN
jgi:DNA-binding XRE family transcriptional regulator